MKKKTRIFMMSMGALLIAAAGIGATLAYFTDTADESNTITMGHVDIDLSEPSFPESGKIENVLPGQKIIKDPTVSLNEGSEDAHVRIKLEFENLEEEKAAQLLSQNPDGSYKYLNININDWRFSDGYFYYTEIMKPGYAMKLFSEVTIPSDWNNEMADRSFEINVKAEAIQAANFTPSVFNGVYGWFYEDGEAVTAEKYKD